MYMCEELNFKILIFQLQQSVNNTQGYQNNLHVVAVDWKLMLILLKQFFKNLHEHVCICTSTCTWVCMYIYLNVSLYMFFNPNPLSSALESILNLTNSNRYMYLSVYLYKQVTVPNLTNSNKMTPLQFE